VSRPEFEPVLGGATANLKNVWHHHDQRKRVGMTRSSKIGAAIAIGVIVIGGASVLAWTAYYFASLRKGAQLARAGYNDMQHGNYDAAITDLSAALQKKLNRRDRFYLYLNRGASYNVKRSFDNAIRDLSEAIRLDPDIPNSYEERGWAYQQKGENDKAMIEFSETIKRDQNSGSAYYNRGMIFYNEGEIDRALLDFEEATRCRPDSPDGFFMRALCYLSKDDLDHALANFDAALTINSANPTFYEKRAEVFTRKGHHEKSLFDRLQAERLRPKPRLAAKGHKLFAPNHTPHDVHLDVEALSRSNTLFETNKAFRELLDEASAASAAGESDRVISLCNRVLAMKIGPATAASATNLRGIAYFENGEVDKALHDYDDALKLNANNAAAYVNRAIVLEEKGAGEEALKDYEEAIRLDPKDYFAYYNRATAFQDKGDLDSALANYDKAVELKPANEDAYVGRAIIYLRAHEPDKAISECTTAIHLDPNAFLAYINRAKAYAQMKQYSLSSADLETATALSATRTHAALNSIAWFRATCSDPILRDGREAVKAAIKACERSHWRNLHYIDTLAAAYAEAGDFEKAVEYEKKTLKMSKGRSRYEERARHRIKLYQQRTPYHEDTPE
jgi:tetratricopeptide (TPR) repeat protein